MYPREIEPTIFAFTSLRFNHYNTIFGHKFICLKYCILMADQKRTKRTICAYVAELRGENLASSETCLVTLAITVEIIATRRNQWYPLLKVCKPVFFFIFKGIFFLNDWIAQSTKRSFAKCGHKTLSPYPFSRDKNMYPQKKNHTRDVTIVHG